MTNPNPNATAQTTGAQQGNQAPVTPPVELTLKRHGKELKVPTEKAVELAQKGLDYEVRTAELAKREAQLKGDEAAYNEYKQLRSSLESDPKLKQAFLRAMQDPDSVIGSKPAAGEGDDGETDSGAAKATQQPDRAVLAELAELKGKVERREIAEQRNQLETNLQNELSQYPWLVESDGSLNRAGKAAFKTAVLSMAHTSEPIPAVAATVANEQREVIEEMQKAGLQKADAASRMRMTSMRGAQVSATPPLKLDKNSISSGEVMKLALQRARERGIL